MASKTYRALVCCRAGIGSSQMLKIECDHVIAEEGYPIRTVTGSIKDIDGFDGDLVITMSDLADDLAANPKVKNVVAVRDIVSKAEINDRLKAFLEAQD